MIKVYTGPTPHSHKVRIMLEGCGFRLGSRASHGMDRADYRHQKHWISGFNCYKIRSC